MRIDLRVRANPTSVFCGARFYRQRVRCARSLTHCGMSKERTIKKNATNDQWCFTLNNYTEDEEVRLKSLMLDPTKKVRYLVLGKEVGDSGTPHIQGYIAFQQRRKFDVVKKLLPARVHLEPTRGTPEQAANYCKKDGSFWERGALPTEVKKQGRRSDIHEARDILDHGGSLMDIAQKDWETFLKYRTSLAWYGTEVCEPRSFKTQVVVFEGEPRTFKSHAAAQYKDSYPVVRPGSGQPIWFDGYRPGEHTAVLFDDFASWLPYHQLLEMCDRYPARVQVKGGTVQFKPLLAVFTANKRVEEWYPGMDERAILDRIDARYTHFRAESVSDDCGYAIGDYLVGVVKGRATWHPLFEYMMPVNQEGLFKLDVEAIRNTFDTQPDEDFLDDFFAHAIGKGINSAPGSQASPIALSSSSASIDDFSED